MAAEAISKVKEAEDKGDEIVKVALDKAKEILKNAEKEGDAQFKKIVAEAGKLRDELIEKAKEQAISECEPIENSGKQEREGILKGTKLAETADLIVKGLVTGNLSSGGNVG